MAGKRFNPYAIWLKESRLLVERTLQIEIESKEDAFEKFNRKDKELEEKIREDLEKEEELKEQLCNVQEHRKGLEEEREIREEKQKKADVVSMYDSL